MINRFTFDYQICLQVKVSYLFNLRYEIIAIILWLLVQTFSNTKLYINDLISKGTQHTLIKLTTYVLVRNKHLYQIRQKDKRNIIPKPRRYYFRIFTYLI